MFRFGIRRRIRRPSKKQSRKSRENFLRHKEAARDLAEEKIKKFNAVYKFNVGRVAIRNQKSRWGSCSRQGNLNFNYKIALLPERLCEYIVVHELCHLGQFNHSRKFWDLVAETVPEYLALRKELRKSEMFLR